jgi:hypothetical protein
MKLRDHIKKAEEIMPRKELAEYLGVHPQQLTDGKNGKAGLPIAACYRLAGLIEEEVSSVVATSELVTEKNEKRRAVLIPFANHVRIAIAAVAITIVTNFVTPAPSEAATMQNKSLITLYIM